MADEIRFTLQGEVEEPAATSRGAHATHGTRVVKRVRLGSVRGQASAQSLVARVGQDVVVLHINGGPSLTLHPESAAALMRAQTAGSTGRSAVLPDGSVEVPMQLGWPGLEQAAGATAAARGASRGWLGQVFASAMEIVTGQSGQPLVNLAAAAVTLKLDGQVDPGVYALQPGALNKLKGSGNKLDAVPAAPTGQPLLVLIHGTFVDTTSTFGKFWAQYPQRVRDLFSFYANRVYALDHRTMGDSPITNALQLVRALPAGAVLHLLTHSRGGVVAEVLARACAQQGLDDESLSGFTAAYANERADLLALAALCRQKNISVQRMLRVACPARGTLLASGRLDAYLSVLQWLLNSAGIPVAGALVDFLDEVARVRGDPAQLPGLEALMPTSPLVLWLNGVAERDEPLASELRVVAGDMQGDSIGSWLKVLMSDAFYWTDNDLVVQTRSMYGGTPRGGTPGVSGVSGGAAQFLLDRGAGVSHFNYFSNERTAAAVVAGLTQARPEGFAAIGPLSWQGDDASGSRAARTVPSAAADAAQRPALIFLPGVLGSNLKSGDRRIWLSLNFFNRLSRLRWDPLGNPGVTPDGVVGRVYGDLAEYLRGTHEVIVFDYDWRAPMEAEARRLGAVLEREIALRQASGQPVRMLAHSMGGLLARTVQLECINVWNDWMARPGTRLLLLGTPHAGAWTPMQVLSGDDTFGNTLVAMGGLFANHATRQLIANLPGFVQLQAGLLDNDAALSKEATWQDLSERDQRLARQYNAWHSGEAQLEAYRWGVPPQAVLDQAAALRRRLDGQAAALQACAAKLVQVVGQVRFTPTGMSVGAGGVEYLDAPQRGDGRVTWDSALLPGVATWLLPVAHDKLPACAEAFIDYENLLLGKAPIHLTALDVAATLAKPPAPDSLRRSRPARASTAEPPPATLEQVFAVADDGPPASNGTGASSHRPALRVQVINGDLRFVQGALLLGHYRALELSGTEAVVDPLLGRRMSETLATGLYPASPGSHQVFVNRSRNLRNPLLPPQPAAVVVAGLGDEGKLGATELVHTIRLAVLAHAQHVLQNAPATQAPPPFELTATLVGSGGPGVSPGISAQLVAQGVREADEQLQDTGWPRVAGLTLIEWYLDRAGEAWLALQAQAQATPGRIDLARAVKEGTGGLRRALEGNYRGAAHDLISAVQTLDENKQPLITYTVDTRRARSEVRAQRAQGPLLVQLVQSASNDGNRDAQIGRTLFNLLVPIELEPTLAGSSEMLLELDAATAAIPWELLNTDAAQTHCDPRPWAIRTKLLRKLRTANFRDAVRDASREDHVLVIGEPKCDLKVYPPLPGARAEAQAVALQLADQLGPDKVTALVSGHDDSRSIINALYSQHYRVVHVAGHGELTTKTVQGGVVLSDGIFLGANEVRAMRTVPELVFLNCCHLAGRDAAALTRAPPQYNRAAFAANIADELIRAGVRCVVAAGWAVEDGPAELFATTFYAALRRGERFSHAVAQAREAAWEASPLGNTWAAYQCYGDPGWRWRDSAHANVQAKPNPLADYGAVSSALALNLALDTLAVRCRYSDPGQAQTQPVHDKLHALEDRFAPLWGSQGTVAEAFGAAYAEAGDTARAIGWYRRAEAALDGSASFRCAEQLANLIARSAEKDTDLARAERGLLEAVQRLDALCALQATPERQALLGSAYKRQALLHARQGRRRSELAALRQAVHHYERAERLAAAGQAGNLYYPALNGLGVQMRLAALERKPLKWPRARLAAIDASLKAAQASAPDFWCEVGAIELRLYRAVAARRLARLAEDLADAFNNLALRVAAPRLWDSVATNERMVLEPYAQRASAPEAKAARMLLATLATLAALAEPTRQDNAAPP